MNRVEYKDMMVGALRDLQKQAGDCIKELESVQGHGSVKQYLLETGYSLRTIKKFATAISDMSRLVGDNGFVEGVGAHIEP